MPAYSSTPLPKKLGIRPGSRVYLPEPPADVRAALRRTLSQCTWVRVAKGPLDFAMVFGRSRSGYRSTFERTARALSPTGILWGCWQKKSSGVATDLGESGVRAIGLGAGLVDVKICSVTDRWSGLKFVRRRSDRDDHG